MNSQASTTDQLRELYFIANQHGLYDAADFIRAHLDQRDCRMCICQPGGFSIQCVVHGRPVAESLISPVASREVQQ